MKRIAFVIFALSVLLAAGCTGDKGKELLETARFEEKQHNIPHAVQLYEEIARKYPGSEQAKIAEARLAELRQGK